MININQNVSFVWKFFSLLKIPNILWLKCIAVCNTNLYKFTIWGYFVLFCNNKINKWYRVVAVSKQVFSFVAIVSTLRTGNKPANYAVHRLNLKSCLKRLVSAYIHKPYSRSLMKSTKISWLILRLWQPFTKFEVTVVGDHPWWSPRKLV